MSVADEALGAASTREASSRSELLEREQPRQRIVQAILCRDVDERVFVCEEQRRVTQSVRLRLGKR
jgi:hypothetical protein